MSRITIVGAGATGTVLGLLLRGQGHAVTIYDARPDPRGPDEPAYRSASITLSERALAVLRAAGAADEVLRRGLTVSGRAMHMRSGRVHVQPYAAGGQALHCVSRLELDRTLLDAAQRAPGIGLRFRHECVAVAPGAGRVTFRDGEGGHLLDVAGDLVIGADGPGSLLRDRLRGAGAVAVETRPFPFGYREFTVPPGPGGAWALDPASVHMWPRGRYALMAFPAAGGEFASLAFLPHEGDSPGAPDGGRDLLARECPDLVALVPDLAQRCARGPLTGLRRVRCYPWAHGGRFVLVGDAAHVILPFYGQGMNAALEDCAVLARCLGREARDPSAALRRYQELRKPNADAIDELAVAHFYYLAGFGETDESVRRKELETELWRRYPDDFVPVYTLVAFGALPYETCRRIDALQSALLGRLLSAAAPDPLDGPAAGELIDEYRRAVRRERQAPDPEP
jgi:kynurenine 3-monooxygenase